MPRSRALYDIMLSTTRAASTSALERQRPTRATWATSTLSCTIPPMGAISSSLDIIEQQVRSYKDVPFVPERSGPVHVLPHLTVPDDVPTIGAAYDVLRQRGLTPYEAARRLVFALSGTLLPSIADRQGGPQGSGVQSSS